MLRCEPWRNSGRGVPIGPDPAVDFQCHGHHRSTCRLPSARWPSNRGRQAVSGVVAALAALGAAELVAGMLTEVPSLLDAVGTFVIDTVPPGVKDAAIAVFGTNDKTALLVGSVLVIAGIGAVVGLLAARWMGWGIIAFAVFGVAGALSALRIPDAPCGWRLDHGDRRRLWWASPSLPVCCGWPAPPPDRATDRGRRAFIVAAGSVVALAALAAAGGRLLADRARRMLAGREDVVLPAAAETVAPPPARASFQIEGTLSSGHTQRRLLSDRHRAHRAEGGPDYLAARIHRDGESPLRDRLLRTDRDAHGGASHHHRLRQQRGRAAT